MASSPIDYNAMISSIYDTVMQLQKSATEAIGLDCMWCRALPYLNSEDLIIQEYTLSNVDCPLPIRVILEKTDYLPGNMFVDLFGVFTEVPLEICISIPVWEAVYGKNTLPQKGDIVIIALLHKPYEVASSSVVYTLSELPTYFKCTLRKYTRTASRRESDELQSSIDELTVTQESLFGDDISREVADTVVERETSYNLSTFVDPMKEFDIDSIKMEHLVGTRGNVISEAYYDFSIAKKNVEYKVSAEFDIEDKYNHWIYTCWFLMHSQAKPEEVPITLTSIYLHDKRFYWFTYISNIDLEEGDEVVLYKGSLMKIEAYVDSKECSGGKALRIKTSDVLKANRQLTNWWRGGNWMIYKKAKNTKANLLKGYSSMEEMINIEIEGNTLEIMFGNIKTDIVIDLKNIYKKDKWHYIAIDFSPRLVETTLVLLDYDGNKYKDTIIYQDSIDVELDSFLVDKFGIEGSGCEYNITNIRLYENLKPMASKYKQDMYSKVTRNANKLIFIDTPNVASKMNFISPIK